MSSTNDDARVVGRVTFAPASGVAPLDTPSFFRWSDPDPRLREGADVGPNPAYLAAKQAEADAKLCDHFAGQALIGLVAYDKRSGDNEPAHFARWAYALADAMMAERAKRDEARRHAVGESDQP